MSLPGLKDLGPLAEARVLLRLDLNVPLGDGAVLDDSRVRAGAPTVRWLLERGAVVGACSHLGKASGRPDPRYSLAPVVDTLAAAVGSPVRFVGECTGREVQTAVATASPGTLLLLENLRFDPGEKSNDAGFAAALAEPFTHYVNDAFGTAHRAHASIAAAAALFPHGHRAAGFLMAAEVEALRRVVSSPEQPFVAVIGGAKISTKTAPLSALVERAQKVLVGGGMANTFLRAAGAEIGRSLVEDEMLETAREVMSAAHRRSVDFLLPEDVVVADRLENPTRISVVAADQVPAELMIVDIGPSARSRFGAAIQAARTVFWNGPMGVFEVEAFAAGTMAIAEAMAACDGFTVVGGGESVLAIHRSGVAGRIGHVSTGGGASLQLISGEALPGVDALEEP